MTATIFVTGVCHGEGAAFAAACGICRREGRRQERVYCFVHWVGHAIQHHDEFIIPSEDDGG